MNFIDRRGAWVEGQSNFNEGLPRLLTDDDGLAGMGHIAEVGERRSEEREILLCSAPSSCFLRENATQVVQYLVLKSANFG